MGVLGSTAISMASQTTRLGKSSSVMAQDEYVHALGILLWWGFAWVDTKNISSS